MPVRAVVVIAVRDGRVLLADIADRGWCVPSGRVEQGESIEEAARRETFEESGATLGPLTLLGQYVLAREHDSTPVSVPTFLADVTSVAPLNGLTESLGVRWAEFDEIPQLYYRWDPLIESVIRYALGSRSG